MNYPNHLSPSTNPQVLVHIQRATAVLENNKKRAII